RLGEREHLLLLTMHHAICDGWSLGSFIRELAAHYAAFAAGAPASLPEPPIQYADYAVWQRTWLRGEIIERQTSYWRRKLAGAPALLKLPTDYERPAARTFGGAEQEASLPASLVEQLKSLGRTEDATLFMTLLAAFNALLQRLTGESDIPIGIPVANRNRAEIEGLLGFFVNTLIVRTDLAGDPSFRELLRRVRVVCLEAFSNQDLPFEKLVEALRPQRASGHSPLFQVMFNFQPLRPEGFELPGLTATLRKADFVMAKFDLSLQLHERPAEVRASLTYNTDIFRAETATRLLRRLETLLRLVVHSPDAPLGTLDLLSEEEKSQRSAGERERKRLYGQKLGATRRKPVALSTKNLVRVESWPGGETLPTLMTPEVESLDLAEWVGGNRELVESRLFASGAILFRGFKINSPHALERVARAHTPELLDYRERTSPRTEIARGVYTSTEYPADCEIPLHNELAYSHQWPMRLWFCCRQPARAGGETPLADSRRVLRLIDPAIKERFERKGIMYVRNFNSGVDLPWREVFQTNDRARVEEYCRAGRIECAWGDEDGLRLRQLRGAVATHPRTLEHVWFNQVVLFHPTSLPPAVRDSLLSVIPEQDLPKNCYYGDGSPIEPSVIDEIRGAVGASVVAFQWQAGDLLMVDNMLAAHGRRPFDGEREILVAMAEPHACSRGGESS
ncbi:MAG: condensation domain-containing protein, partial [Pyrinomonadaceae bacterium]